MFGGKLKKNPPDGVAAATPEEKPPEPPGGEKKGPRERIQEIAREKIAEREARIKAEKECEKLREELKALQGKDEKDKSRKEILKEIHLEDKLREQEEKRYGELENYRQSLPEGELDAFNVSYDYYVGKLKEDDNDTLEIMWSYPQRFEMLDVFMKLANTGNLNYEAWIKTPLPAKHSQLKELADFVLKPEIAQPLKPQPKKVPDSIVPNLKPKSEPPEDSSAKGSVFKKVFERGIGH